MKKGLLLALAITLTFLSGSATVYANIDNLSNMSAEWIRTGNRNAATDAADIVLYNPAGLTELTQGVHLNFGNQSMIRKPEHTFNLGTGENSYEQDSADAVLPNIYGSFNRANWSVFGGVYIPGGGAVVDYPDGSFATQLIGSGLVQGYIDGVHDQTGKPQQDIAPFYSFSEDSLEASSIYVTTTLGGAYKLNEKISFGLGMRYINAKNTLKAELTFTDGTPTLLSGGVAPPEISKIQIETEDTAEGVGGIFSVNFMPTPKLNLALQYQSRVELDFKTEVKKDTFTPVAGEEEQIFIDGAKNRRDLPAFAGFGAGYKLTDKLYGEINFSYWFQKDAEWGKDESGNDVSDLAGDAWSTGATFSYQALSKLLVSAGTTFTKFEWDDMDGYYAANLGSVEVLYTDNWHVGAGAAYEIADGMKVNISAGRTIWEDETLTLAGLEIDTQNATTTIAVGFDAAF